MLSKTAQTMLRRNGMPALVKFAALGGDGNDTAFEQSFSILARTYLEDRAPSIFEDELGFQLLERDDDGKRAVGIFVFKPQDTLLAIPVFFLRGKLKGHELMYVYKDDIFVPFKENWINEIKNQSSSKIGDPITKNTSELGVRQPELTRITNSPYKYAEHVTPAVRPVMPVVGHLATGDMKGEIEKFASHCSDRLDLTHFLKQASLPTIEVFADLLRRFPKIAKAYDQWHGLAELQEIVKEARMREEERQILDGPKSVNIYQGDVLDELEKNAGPKGKLKIITIESTIVSGPITLPGEESDMTLPVSGVEIQDDRDTSELSHPIDIQVEKHLQNPHETGIYQLLVAPGEFKRCLVVVNPMGPEGRADKCVIVDLESNRKSAELHNRDTVWVLDQDEFLQGNESWDEFLESLPTADSLKAGDSFVLLEQLRDGTVPLTVSKERGRSGGVTTFELSIPYMAAISGRRSISEITRDLRKDLTRRERDPEEYKDYVDGSFLQVDDLEGRRIRRRWADIYVSPKARVLRFTTSNDKLPGCKCPCHTGGHPVVSISDTACCACRNERPIIQPGSVTDAYREIMAKTAELQIFHDRDKYYINNGERGLDKIAALIHLVRDHGFREGTARSLMKKAESESRKTRSAYKTRVKYAAAYLTESGPSAPGFPNLEYARENPMAYQGPTVGGVAQEQVIPDLSAAHTDREIYRPRPGDGLADMQRVVQQAEATGQKEVFDTATIGSLLRASRDSQLVDRYLPDLIKALDGVGRILFMFYWRNDQFMERYGKADMEELEDSLRNTFENIGDLVIFLKQKTIVAFPGDDLLDFDLGESGAEI